MKDEKKVALERIRNAGKAIQFARQMFFNEDEDKARLQYIEMKLRNFYVIHSGITLDEDFEPRGVE